jgi:hypothetical protein
MHPLWQIKQVITVPPDRHVDRCNQFGGGAAGRIWWSFIAPVLWIAIHVKSIPDVFGYVDDEFSWEFASNVSWYTPYNKFMPTKQVKLLELWDELGIPHEERKQVFGSPLTIIGFDVDPNRMTITMPQQSRDDLVKALRDFAVPGLRHALRDFQRLAGWINWSLNAYPLLRPGLSTLYDKIAGKCHPHQLIWVSQRLCRELLWTAIHIESVEGVLMMESIEWTHNDAELTFYADAYPYGLGFWSPNLLFAGQYLSDSQPTRDIVYLEGIAVLCALSCASSLPHRPHIRIAIFTDNFDIVDIFNSLKASPVYNPIIMTASDILLSSAINLRVFHIPGQLNVVADALSRFHNSVALSYEPDLQISLFQPPRVTLGADLN